MKRTRRKKVAEEGERWKEMEKDTGRVKRIEFQDNDY